MKKLTPAPIISIPHPHLRQVARPVVDATPATHALAKRLALTLKMTKNPTGVGLAAPQIDQPWRVFATQLNDQIEVFFNPVIAAHSLESTFGEDDDEPDLEGCLSIPKLYGPVPRWTWVELEFDQLTQDTFVRAKRRFSEFPARVIQHEYDHLEGILFIDYSIQFDLPIYTAHHRGEKMTEVPRDIFETLHHSTLGTQATEPTTTP